MKSPIVFQNLEAIVQVCSDKESFKTGPEQDKLAILSRKSERIGCCLYVDKNGIIQFVGYDDEMPSSLIPSESIIVDGKGCTLIPGFIDAHTHPIWSGDRVFEFELKMKGASYLDIHSKGGGIYSTVTSTRQSSQEELLELFLQRLDLFASCGTTVVEAKTGYGLDLETEKKMLQVIKAAQNKHPLEIVANLLVGHAIPKGMSSQEATKGCIDIIRAIGKEASTLPKIEFVDVFCEKGVYTVDETEEILKVGKEVLGSLAAFHGEELSCLNSAEMAARIGCRSISHCEYISQEGINSIAKSKTAAIICPTTAFLLRLNSPPVREMMNAGVIVCIGSDFNPNAYCYSMSTAMNIAVVYCKMTLNEALVAATINAAYAVNRSETHGSLEVGKRGDLVLLKTNDWRNIVYQIGDTRSLIKAVFVGGKLVKGSL